MEHERGGDIPITYPNQIQKVMVYFGSGPVITKINTLCTNTFLNSLSNM